MKFLFAITLLTLVSGANAHDPMMPATVKERLRLLLWFEGIEESVEVIKPTTASYPKLPEEIERPLRKM